MIEASLYQPDRGLKCKVVRKVTQYRFAEPFNIRPTRPILSLTFDDCPKTAVDNGAKLLDDHGQRGCFYIATGLFNADTPMGKMASADDVKALFQAGHEIGAHTHSHLDLSKASVPVATSEITQNLEILDTLGRGQKIESFAFPYGETSFDVKRKLISSFSTLRGINAGHHYGRIDRAQLYSCEIDGTDASVDRLISYLTRSLKTPAWTIMFTHDVQDEPTQYGISPIQLKRLIEFATANDIDIRTPADVMREFGVAS